MTDKRWQEIEKLYHSVLAREPAQRSAFLKEACAGDSAMLREVQSLLAQQTEAENFIESPALEVAAKELVGHRVEPTVVIPGKQPSHSLIGQTVSHYRILEKLGEGGMGVVYKAQDLKLERLVALKFFPPHFSPDEEEKIRFMREARAASALDHPNIGTIYEIAETDDRQMFIAMAYYEGETLKQKIERGPLPLEEALGIALQMARGLAKAHDRQIVHRDIKPANVIVTRETVVKVIDFGLAKLGGLTKITKTHTTMGTVAYMSPEQARGEEVDERTDVWSLGVVLYEMLAGQLPFPGTNAEAIIHAILTAKPKPLKQLRGDVPAEIERIIYRAVEKDLNSRYAWAAEVLQDLNECYSSLTLPEMRLGGWKLLSGWVRQKRVAIPGILLLLLLGSLLGWLFHRQAKVRWVREEALPEIRRLIDEERYMAAFALARQAEEYIPASPQLVKLWPEMSNIVSIHTTPPGADVSMKEYSAMKGGWTYLGQSPLDRIRIPLGGVQLKAEKKGFVNVETVEGPWTEGLISLELDSEGSLPVGMVHALSGSVPITLNLPGLDHLEPVQLPGYWIDKYEVTNKDFKAFVDKGGYQKREYWRHEIVKGGHEIPWSEAMADFSDTTGRPGPSTWEMGNYPQGQDDYPVSGVSWYEAAAYAEFVGKSLPTIYHWNNAAITWLSNYIVPLSNFSHQGLARVGSYQNMSRYGTYDMAGNVKEWCWNEAGLNRRYILGGAWNEPDYMFNEADAQSPSDRRANFGFRCVKYLSRDDPPRASTAPVEFAVRNYNNEKPVSDETFQIYKSLYSYDKTPLNPKVESVDERDEKWKKEQITFAAAYGKERMIAYLFLPKKFPPPFQTIILFPGVDAITMRAINESHMRLLDIIIISGRAVLWPIYKGTFQRGDDLKSGYPNTTGFWRDHVIYWSKDLGRSIDYLETRPEIDHQKIGYFGISWGAAMGAMMPALDGRLKVSVLYSGGFNLQKALPEVDAINFAPRVTIPTLMLNGRNDFFFPVNTSQEPMFRFLGTPKENKRHMLFEGGHSIPRTQLIEETLDWLDRYLGPVKPKEP